MKPIAYWRHIVVLPAAAVAAVPLARATTYLNVEQAQQLIFPGASPVPVSVSLNDAQRSAMRDFSGVREPFKTDRIWRIPDGGYFIVDQVVGKHEMITYAIGINPDGSVRQIEIMEYNESYGYEIREAAWRQQFVGKTVATPPKLNGDIRNISGATLSCKHVTDGVRRVLWFVDNVLKGQAHS